MAAAWLNALANPTEAVAISAGTQPASQVHPQVIDARLEVGVDLSAARPQFLSEKLARRARLCNHDGLRRGLPPFRPASAGKTGHCLILREKV
jgi:protein-tyrosine-phosphatase